jgi:hypothetical protein
MNCKLWSVLNAGATVVSIASTDPTLMENKSEDIKPTNKSINKQYNFGEE